MVIVRLEGGLGNQLFQYAAARRLSLSNNVPIKLDILEFQRDRYQRTYCLNHFNISEDLVSAKENVLFTIMNKLPLSLRRSFSNIYRWGSYIQEKEDYVFDKNIFNLKFSSDIYLSGYFQSEEYFGDIEDIIRKEFSVKYKPDSRNEEISLRINNTPSVCLHLRRLHGIAVNGAKVNGDGHGTLPLDYYYEAIKQLTKIVKDPHFYVFSDDPVWAQSNLKLDYPKEFISHNGGRKDYEDLRLMTLCKHHIIPNSTFSWWGAWLGKKQGQLVFAPRIWHAALSNSKNIIPDSWHRI